MHIDMENNFRSLENNLKISIKLHDILVDDLQILKWFYIINLNLGLKSSRTMLAPSRSGVGTVRLTRFCFAFMRTKNEADDLAMSLNSAAVLRSVVAVISAFTPAEG